MELHIVEVQGLLPKGGPKGSALVRFLVIKKRRNGIAYCFCESNSNVCLNKGRIGIFLAVIVALYNDWKTMVLDVFHSFMVGRRCDALEANSF